MRFEIRRWGGIGDILMLTPTLRVLKETYPDSTIHVSTNIVSVLRENPYINQTTGSKQGKIAWYPAPNTYRKPHQHHIYSMWESVKRGFGVECPRPSLQPEIYVNHEDLKKKDLVGVQVRVDTGQWHNRKIWPRLETLSMEQGYEALPWCNTIEEVVSTILSYKLVVCIESGISHLCKALGIPAVVIYGGFSSPKWAGYDDQINVVSNMSCAPCYGFLQCYDYVCINKIEVDKIKEIVDGACSK